MSCRASSCDSEKSIEREQPRKKRARSDDRVELCMLGVRAFSEYGARCEDALPWWGTIDRVVERTRGACRSMVNAPGARYERDDIEACVAAVRKMECGEKPPRACRFAGTLTKGSPCLFGIQCGQGLFCHVALGKSCGKCAPYAEEGDVCGDGCDETLVCIDGRCRSPRGKGEACASPFDCNKMLRCVPDPKSPGSSVCMPHAKEGEPCSTFDCAPSLRCESGVCKPRPTPKAAGAPCTDVLDCMDFACISGTCHALGDEGEPCPDADHRDRAPCSPSFSCVDGTCKTLDATACEAPP